jgi:putative component of toxin-antitoxin plasmid stabilization module
MSYQVVELLLEDGSSPFGRWLDSLDPQAATKITVAAYQMECGNLSRVEWFSGIGEYKIDWGPGYPYTLPRMVSGLFCSLAVVQRKRRKRIFERRYRSGMIISRASGGNNGTYSGL